MPNPGYDFPTPMSYSPDSQGWKRCPASSADEPIAPPTSRQIGPRRDCDRGHGLHDGPRRCPGEVHQRRFHHMADLCAALTRGDPFHGRRVSSRPQAGQPPPEIDRLGNSAKHAVDGNVDYLLCRVGSPEPAHCRRRLLHRAALYNVALGSHNRRARGDTAMDGRLNRFRWGSGDSPARDEFIFLRHLAAYRVGPLLCIGRGSHSNQMLGRKPSCSFSRLEFFLPGCRGHRDSRNCDLEPDGITSRGVSISPRSLVRDGWA